MPETDNGLWFASATLAKTPPADGPIEFTASTTAMNRKGYSLRTDGWRLENYRRNPVVLWMHIPFRPPVGRADMRVEEGELRAAVEFDLGDALGADLDRKYRNRFLNAVSVGFDPVDEEGNQLDTFRLKPEEIRDEAFYDLLELSAVSVPADAGAVKRSLSALSETLGLPLAPLEATPLEPLAAEVGRLSREELAELVDEQLRRYGLEPTDLAAALKRLAAPQTPEPTPEPVGISHRAAEALLAAFAPKEGDS
jgi:hypothetical protein